MIEYNPIVIDFNSHIQIKSEVWAVQRDHNTRLIEFEFKVGSNPYDLTNKTARIYIDKPDGQIFDDLNVINNTGGLAQLPLSNAFTTNGDVLECQISVTDNLTGDVINSRNFHIQIFDNIRNDDAIQATSEFTALENALKSVGNIDSIKNQVDINTDQVKINTADIKANKDSITLLSPAVAGLTTTVTGLSTDNTQNKADIVTLKNNINTTNQNVTDLGHRVDNSYQVLDNKVDKIPGKELSTNDFTNEQKQKLDGLTSAIVLKGSVNNQTELDAFTNNPQLQAGWTVIVETAFGGHNKGVRLIWDGSKWQDDVAVDYSVFFDKTQDTTDDITEASDKKFMTAAERSKLNFVPNNTNAELNKKIDKPQMVLTDKGKYLIVNDDASGVMLSDRPQEDIENDIVNIKSRLDDLDKPQITPLATTKDIEQLQNSVDGYLDWEGKVFGNTIVQNEKLISLGKEIDLGYKAGEKDYLIDVLSVNKNLFDGKLELGSIDLSNGNEISSSDTVRSTNFTKIESNKNISVGGINRLVFYFYDKNYSFIKSDSTSLNKFLIPSNASYFKFRSFGGDTTDLNTKIQIEYGTQVTQYISQDQDKTEILTREPLRAVGTSKDYVNSVGKVWRENDEIVLESTFNWLSFREGTNTVYAHFKLVNSKKLSPVLCDTFNDIGDLYNTDKEGVHITSTNYLQLRVNKSKLNSVDLIGLKQWLSENSITVQYQLLNPNYSSPLSFVKYLPNGVEDEIIEKENGELELVENVGEVILKDSDFPNMYIGFTQIDLINLKTLPNQINFESAYVIEKTVYINDMQQVAFADDSNLIGKYFTTNSGNRIAFIVNKGTTLQQAKTQLIGTKILYQLAIPTTRPLTATERQEYLAKRRFLTPDTNLRCWKDGNFMVSGISTTTDLTINYPANLAAQTGTVINKTRDLDNRFEEFIKQQNAINLNFDFRITVLENK